MPPAPALEIVVFICRTPSGSHGVLEQSVGFLYSALLPRYHRIFCSFPNFCVHARNVTKSPFRLKKNISRSARRIDGAETEFVRERGPSSMLLTKTHL